MIQNKYRMGLKPDPGSAWTALERLMWITAYDRVRTRDRRVIWYGDKTVKRNWPRDPDYA